MIRTLGRRAKRTLRNLLFWRPNPFRSRGGAKRHEWSIGIYGGASPFEIAPKPGVKNPVLTREHISDVPAMFAADPFMLRVNGGWYMFFEIMNARTLKGEIGLATSENGLTWKYRQIVLAEPFHLSYPYVFEWMGSVYMIPESGKDQSIRLYEASSFPTQWALVGYLLTGQSFADTSVFRYREQWWMFTATHPDKYDVLRLYHADELLGPWREHPQSPIVNGDAHVARPAGRALVLGNTVIRFTQDCEPIYGTQVRAFEVTELTPTTYAERAHGEHPLLAPSGVGWNASGMHHVDAHRLSDGQWLACVDGWIGV